LEKEADELRTQVQELTKAREELSAEMARLAPLEKENAQLKEQVEALRPDAEAHVMLRGQVGAIECEARQRFPEPMPADPVPRRSDPWSLEAVPA